MGSTTNYPTAGGSGDTTTYSYCWFDSANAEMGYFGFIAINADDLGNIDNLIVAVQGQSSYNEASLVPLSTGWQRFDDATGLGALNGPNDTQPKARRSYSAQWFDGMGRNVASANYGTNGGAVVSRPDVVPERSDTVLVSSTHYKDDGEANAVIDPEGIETRWDNDAIGRRIRLIENYKACGTGSDENRTTEYAYAPDGGQERLTLINSVTGDQVTRWVYGTIITESEIASSGLLRAKIYPESDDQSSPLDEGYDGTYERIEYEYNRQGDATQMKDSNESVHAFEYDEIGRQTQDRITSFGNGVDTTIKRLKTAHDTKRLILTKVTSYDDATVGMGAVINEVEFVYDDFGQLSEDRQEHSGAVTTTTPAVEYHYEDGNRANTTRRIAMFYPDGRKLNYDYGSNTGANDRLSRVEALQIQAEVFQLASYTYVGAALDVKTIYSQPGVQLSYFKVSGSPDGDAGDQYSGYDRFGRPVDMRWVMTSGGAARDRIQYGYDRASNRVWRKNLAATSGGQDNAYNYDGLYQVKRAELGTLNLNQSAIGAIPAQAEDFSYDPSGNWTHYTQSEDGTEMLDQSRVSNQDNQMTQIDGSSDGISYDRAGNSIKLPPDVDGDWAKYYQLVWDGWNRLVEIKDEADVTVANYGYDGLYRRTLKVVGAETRDYYYNDEWKCVEERSDAPSSSSSAGSVGSSSSSSSSSFIPSSSSSGGGGSSSSSPGNLGNADIQYVWSALSRNQLVLRDRDTNGDGTLNERLYCLMDALDPTSVVDTTGGVLERYAFSAFGLRTIMDASWVDRASSSFDFEFAFHGEFEDPETGYVNYGYRYYSLQVGRWLSRDPIEENGGLNLYGFINNSPLNFGDHFGLSGDESLPTAPDPPFCSVTLYVSHTNFCNTRVERDNHTIAAGLRDVGIDPDSDPFARVDAMGCNYTGNKIYGILGVRPADYLPPSLKTTDLKYKEYQILKKDYPNNGFLVGIVSNFDVGNKVPAWNAGFNPHSNLVANYANETGLNRFADDQVNQANGYVRLLTHNWKETLMSAQRVSASCAANKCCECKTITARLISIASLNEHLTALNASTISKVPLSKMSWANQLTRMIQPTTPLSLPPALGTKVEFSTNEK
ncbi:MAG: RHS repeat-associated core domain-containing protein [Verrucomicrobia bacterium]|nr:RHS repeat-associated core domain-containing protein [Verrucomicrobiota bacterium]